MVGHRNSGITPDRNLLRMQNRLSLKVKAKMYTEVHKCKHVAIWVTRDVGLYICPWSYQPSDPMRLLGTYIYVPGLTNPQIL